MYMYIRSKKGWAAWHFFGPISLVWGGLKTIMIALMAVLSFFKSGTYMTDGGNQKKNPAAQDQLCMYKYLGVGVGE